MSLNNEKKSFIKKISGGLHVLMTCSYKADEIGTKPECPVEAIYPNEEDAIEKDGTDEYVKKNYEFFNQTWNG